MRDRRYERPDGSVRERWAALRPGGAGGAARSQFRAGGRRVPLAARTASGAGKTSLLRLMYLAIRPTRGRLASSAPISRPRSAARCRGCGGGSGWCSRISACCRTCRRSTMWRCRCGSPAGRRARSAPTSARCCAGWAWRSKPARDRRNCRGASSSGWRSRARWSAAPACCSPTSRPATSTKRRPRG